MSRTTSVSRLAGLVVLALSLAVVPPLAAQGAERVDLDAVTRIRLEGLQRGRAMEVAAKLCDEIGPRLTGSPAYRKAAEWAQGQLTAWGLSNARLAPFEFGRGWVLERAAVHMLTPQSTPLPAWPKAWTPGTDGPRSGAAVLVKVEREEDLATWKGKLEGKVVLLGDVPEARSEEKPDSERYSDEELSKLARYEARDGRRGRDRLKMRREFQLRRKVAAFLAEEKVLAVLEPSRGDDGTVFLQGGGTWRAGEPDGVVTLVVGSEAYGRMARLLGKKVPVEVEVDVKARFTEPDPLSATNVLAELPGTDRKDEVVMIGAHLDSWQAGTGATDNAVGVAAVMEAMRILKAAGLTPRRTIRVALWGGEEQGFLGSRAFVEREVATRPALPAGERDAGVPEWLRGARGGPLTLKPGHAKLSAYFNLDNGAGKVRGIYTQENAGVRPLFEAWLAPLADLGATTVTNRSTGGTDHQPFDQAGVPGFQFIQDPLDYMSRTHHSNRDVLERIPAGDLAQASVVVATFAWQAAQRDAMLPRKPLPPSPPAGSAAEAGPDRAPAP